MVSTLKRNQAERRRRVLDAALTLAADGGFDSVQMRDVAAAADVALGTLYRYFPSKEHLLISALKELVDAHAQMLRNEPARGGTEAERVLDVLRRSVPMHPERDVFAAMVRALASAGPGVAVLVADVNATMTTSITDAMHEGEPSERDLAVARVLQQVWLSAVIGWLGGVEDKSRIMSDLEAAVSLLLTDKYDT